MLLWVVVFSVFGSELHLHRVADHISGLRRQTTHAAVLRQPVLHQAVLARSPFSIMDTDT